MSKEYGVREITNVVWRALRPCVVGGKTFYEGEPVLYFDSLKTATLEGASTTVYAQGGRGNARLISWDGEKTLTLTIEDALISVESFQLLAGAQIRKQKKETHSFIRLGIEKALKIGQAGTCTSTTITLPKGLAAYPDNGSVVYVLPEEDDAFETEPYICVYTAPEKKKDAKSNEYTDNGGTLTLILSSNYDTLKAKGLLWGNIPVAYNYKNQTSFDVKKVTAGQAVYLDYYTTEEEEGDVIRIEPESLGYCFYIEGETLFRGATDGLDYPATFTLPKARVQNNFSISMASSGDPSAFSFVLDAFPGYTRCNNTKKCLCEIVISDKSTDKNADNKFRTETKS